MVLAGSAGAVLAASWRISLPTLAIATGIVFFLVALHVVMEQYRPDPPPPPLPSGALTAALSLTFPTLVTPYGIAAVITLLAATGQWARKEVIWVMLLLVMTLNLLAMLFVRVVMKEWPMLVLRLVGAVLGVLQVALAVQIMVRGLRDLRMLQGE
jgi:multiple antibiotic resistance protein